MDIVLKWNKMEGYLQFGKEGDFFECQYFCWILILVMFKRQKVIGIIV